MKALPAMHTAGHYLFTTLQRYTKTVKRLYIVYYCAVFNRNGFVLPHALHTKRFTGALGSPSSVNIYPDRTLFTAEVEKPKRYIAVFKIFGICLNVSVPYIG